MNAKYCVNMFIYIGKICIPCMIIPTIYAKLCAKIEFTL